MYSKPEIWPKDLYRIKLDRFIFAYSFIQKVCSKKVLILVLSFTILSANSVDTIGVIFLTFVQNKIWHFMQFVSIRDNLHEMLNLFSGKNWKIFQYVVLLKILPSMLSVYSTWNYALCILIRIALAKPF